MAKMDAEKIEHPGLREFFRKGLALMEQSGQAVEIKPGSAEWNAWVTYFDRIVGKRPIAMTMTLNDQGQGAITVPTQWPQWFDSRAA
jgi:hypothetical protein